MTVHAPCTARRGAFLVRMALLLVPLLAGCGSLPFLRDESKPAEPPPVATKQQYHVEVDAPAPLPRLLLDFLDLARFQSAPEAEAIDAPELNRLAAAAPAQARNLLETEGYFNPEVAIERGVAPDGLPLLRVQVTPGPRALVASFALSARGALQVAAEGDADGGVAAAEIARLRSDWPLEVGKPFRQSDWSTAKKDTLARLRAAGYPGANWDTTAARVDAVRNQVHLEVALDSGPLYRLGALRVEGLERYPEASVRQLSNFHAGQPYSEKLLLDYQERLQKIGLFESAVVELDAAPATHDAAPVLVRVREMSLQQATVGVGATTNTGPRVTLEHRHRRPFGLDWIATNKFELGSDKKSWEGELISHPLQNLYRNLVSGNVEDLRSGEEVRTSASARLGRTQDTPRIERTYFGEVVYARVENPAGTSSSEAVTGNYHWLLREVDSVLLPTDGYTLALQGALGYARSSSAESGPLTRAYARAFWYRPLGDSWYAKARVETGQVFARDAVGIPDTLLFRAGGDDSVRGYAYRELGPVVDGVVTSGRMLMTGSLEIARPVSEKLPSVWWATFIDAGNAANRWNELDPALGYGVGVRWRSPVGPLAADLAYGERNRKVRLHFSVGIVF